MKRLALALAFSLAAAPALAFSFGEEDEQQKAADDAGRQRGPGPLATPCKQALKDRKIMVVPRTRRHGAAAQRIPARLHHGRPAGGAEAAAEGQM